MVRDLAIYGAGGLGREMAVMVRQINEETKQWNLIGFYDDGLRSGSVDDLAVLGGMAEINATAKPLSIMIAIADSGVRETIAQGIKNPSIRFPVFTHPRSIVGSKGNTIGPGSIITAGCILTTGITLGKFVIVNLASTIGHDVTVGDYASIMPGCNISGAVVVGDKTLIGTGAKILQGISIGNRCRVGAGAVVTHPVDDALTVTGVPAKPVK